MEILYLSSLCSLSEQDYVFEKYGSISSFASQRFNRLFVEGLIENGADVTALTYEYLPTTEKVKRERKEECEKGINYIYLPLGLNKLSLIACAIKEIKKWSKYHKEGFVICDTIIGELSIALNVSKIQNPKVAVVTDVPLARASDNRKGLKRLPAVLKQKQIYKFDSFVFLTKQMNDDLNRHNKPYVIIEGFAKKDQNVNNGKRSKVCIMAGLLEEVFGVQLLIEAFKKITLMEAKMVFYGKGRCVDNIVEAGKNDQRIVYGGVLPNNKMIEEEKKALLLINPRPNIDRWTAYSFPSKNIEYMSTGTPLVAFKLPGIPDEYDGYYYRIEKNDSNHLALFLEELLKKPVSELEEFGNKSKNWLLENKTPYLQAKKCIEMLKGMKK